MLNVSKVLLLTYIGSLPLYSCTTTQKQLDCYKINGREYCREKTSEDDLEECIQMQQAIYRGQEATLPFRCDKFKDRYQMTHVVKRN